MTTNRKLNQSNKGLTMKTNELYEYLLAHESILITIASNSLQIIKRRLIKKKQRDQAKLGEFADRSKQLQFMVVSDDGEKLKLRISIVDRSGDIELFDCEPAADF